MQLLLASQPRSDEPVDMLSAAADLLATLVGSVVTLPEDDAESQRIRGLFTEVFDFMEETALGPCRENQITLSKTSLLPASNRLLSYLEHLTPQQAEIKHPSRTASLHPHDPLKLPVDWEAYGRDTKFRSFLKIGLMDVLMSLLEGGNEEVAQRMSETLDVDLLERAVASVSQLLGYGDKSRPNLPLAGRSYLPWPADTKLSNMEDEDELLYQSTTVSCCQPGIK